MTIEQEGLRRNRLPRVLIGAVALALVISMWVYTDTSSLYSIMLALVGTATVATTAVLANSRL